MARSPSRSLRFLAPLAATGSLIAVVFCAPSPSRAETPPAAPSASSPRTPIGPVLHIGDSFVDAGLQQALRPMFAAEETRYHSFGRVRAWLSTWSDQAGLETMMARYRPSLVLITLGANEMVDRTPERRAVLVRRLVRRLNGVPCVWVGHPVWRGVGPGLMHVVRRSCEPCRFFDSVPMSDTIRRQPDGIHPDKEGGALWAKAVFDWLQQERDPARGPWGMRDAPRGEHGEELDAGADGSSHDRP